MSFINRGIQCYKDNGLNYTIKRCTNKLKILNRGVQCYRDNGLIYTFIRVVNKLGYCPTLKHDLNVLYNPDLNKNLITLKDDMSQKPLYYWELELIKECNVAVQAHVFYVDILDEIISNLNYIPYSYDLFISTDDIGKARIISDVLRKRVSARKIVVEVFDNKGRDVVPFLKQMQIRYKNYEYICHLHTKKSLYDDYGNIWRKVCYERLLGSTNNIRSIFKCFRDDLKLGLVFPYLFKYGFLTLDWGGEKQRAIDLFSKIGCNNDLPKSVVFPAGNMLWLRTHAVHQMLDIDFNTINIPEELGQTNGTIMHALERLWVYVAKENDYTFIQIED